MELRVFLVFAGLFFITINACKDETKQDNGCTYAPVDITLYLNTPSANGLNVPNNPVYLSGGVRGIVVHKTASDLYIAVERNCTYDCNNTNCSTVKANSSNLLVDSCCGSKFNLDGTLVKGPATRNLRTYPAIRTGDALRITN